jgi:hypothetical protein
VIPRIVHWLWLGPDAVPDIFRHYTESWRTHHPGWEMRMWRDDSLPPLSCQAEYDQTTGFKKRYDIARLEILRQFGGVIVDMDVEAIRPLDPLLGGVTAFVGRISDKHVGNQVLGAVPGHPFFERAVAQLRAATGGGTASEVAGKDFLRRLLETHPDGVTVFPPETFYYQPSFDPPRRPDAFPGVYAVHHELASYAEMPPADTLELRFAAFVKEVNTAHGAALTADAQARVDRAERRVSRAIATQERAYRAKLRQLEAEREQAEARLREVQERLTRIERR